MPASLLWFHDHGLGATRLNVFAGLAAAYILRDEFDTGYGAEPHAGFPVARTRSRSSSRTASSTADGTFLYPTSDIPGATWIGEYFGDVMLVNGKVWPFLEVEPRMYRFRILNGCNARILSLDIGGPSFWQIGAEGGMWDPPVPMKRAGARAGRAGGRARRLQQVRRRQARDEEPQAAEAGVEPGAPARAGDADPRRHDRHQPGPASIPSSLPGRKADLGSPVSNRYITLNEIDADEATWFLNLNGMRFDESPVTETPEVGTVEDWVYVNLTGRHAPDAHASRHVPGGRPDTVRRRGLRGGERSGPRRPRRDRPDARSPPGRWSLPRPRSAASRTPSRPTPATSRPSGPSSTYRGRGGAADLRPPLPHRGARGQRHDAPLRGRDVTVGKARWFLGRAFTPDWRRLASHSTSWAPSRRRAGRRLRRRRQPLTVAAT